MLPKKNNNNSAQPVGAKKAETARVSKLAADLARKPLTASKVSEAARSEARSKKASTSAKKQEPAVVGKAPVAEAQTVRKSAPAVAKAAAPASATGAAAGPTAKAVAASAAVSPKKAEPRKIEAAKPEAKKPSHRQGFKTHEYVVYPAHGVGQIVSIEEQEVAGYKLELFVINFVKDKMTLRVPTPKVASVGMRKLSEPAVVQRSLETLQGRARVKRTMWSRRAQEYEAKINSGDIVAIAEVVRDLFRSDSQPEQSYSERQLYEAALDRLAREVAVVERLTETEAVKAIEAALAKGPRRGAKPADGAEAEAETDDGIVTEEAA